MSDPTPRSSKYRFIAPLIWAALITLLIVPLAIAMTSSYLASRNAEYIIAGIAGIICLGMFLLQPMLAANYLPGIKPAQGRRWHRRIGVAIMIGVILHVGGLYITSPPDTVDALLLISPTSFSVFGVVAMWSIFIAAALVFWRSKLGFGYPIWLILHNILALIAVIATVIHALQIEGTMGTTSKIILCVAVLVVLAVTFIDLRVIKPLKKYRNKQGTAKK